MPATHQFNNASNSPIQYWQQLTTNSILTETHQFNKASDSPIQYWQQLTTNSIMTETHRALASFTFFLPPSIFHLCKLAWFQQFKNCGTQLVTVRWVCDRGKHLLSLLGHQPQRQNDSPVSPETSASHQCHHSSLCCVNVFVTSSTTYRDLQCSGFWPFIITHFQATDLTFQDKFWWTEMSHMVSTSVILLPCTDHTQLSHALSFIK